MKRSSALADVAALGDMPYRELAQRYVSLFGRKPPAPNRKQVVARLAYRIQELAMGGLSQDARDQLDRIYAEHGASDKPAGSRKDVPVPGTRLIREWRGKRHEIVCIRGGFEYAGKTHRSLSPIAKIITGTQWNGPNFFGLRRKTKEKANA